VKLDANRPVAVVTGASAGIGKATARELVELGWQVIGVGRDPERTAAAEAEIKAVAEHDVTFVMLRGDFTLMTEVKCIAQEIESITDRLDVLINNAGGVRDRQIVTAEGTEATFAANHLAPFLLTRELMALLESSTTRLAPGATRVIAVSSTAHRATEGLNWDDLQSLGDVPPTAAYCRAKLANILFTRELALRKGPDGIVAQAMHPGIVDSNFASYGDEAMRAHMAAAEKVLPEEPAETLVWLATDPEGGRKAGRYFYRRAEETPSEAAQDLAAAARLWTETEVLLTKLAI
jgi:NAD(P)-dependent dehydrogenase (short-subunit alcohol dehydrogenase family)